MADGVETATLYAQPETFYAAAWQFGMVALITAETKDSLLGEIDRIRKAVREGNYVFTDHVIEEAQADDLLLEDVIQVLLSGEIDSTYSDDPRGTRYVVRGDSDGLEIDVVCRFKRDGTLLIIITVYIVG
jgi:Domain of unknown function (DUF4258)